MKTIVLKILLITNFLFLSNCRAQTTTDYITFYNDVVPKLNTMVPNKTQYYNQPFSNFYNELQNKNINIVGLFCDTKTDLGTKYYILKLFFGNTNMLSVASSNSFMFPRVYVTFKDEIPQQVDNLITQHQAQWNPVFEQYFANMKIEKIDFIDANGYNSTDNIMK